MINKISLPEDRIIKSINHYIPNKGELPCVACSFEDNDSILIPLYNINYEESLIDLGKCIFHYTSDYKNNHGIILKDEDLYCYIITIKDPDNERPLTGILVSKEEVNF